jgi:L,D-transpeptidase YcbB
MNPHLFPAWPSPVRIMAALLLAAAVSMRAAAEPRTGPSQTIRIIAETTVHPDFTETRIDRWNDLLRTYESNGFTPLWVGTDGPTQQANAVVTVLHAADADGLRPADYRAQALADDVTRWADHEASEEEIGRFDTALTLAILNYASDASRGRVDPQAAGFERSEEPTPFDQAEFVQGLAQAENPAQRLAALDPPIPVFARLRTALAHMRTLAARTDIPHLPDMPTLHPGESNPHIPELRRLLVALGDLSNGKVPQSGASLYDSALVAAVKSFQERHGLDVDGTIGRGTLNEMRVPLGERARQIEFAMERLRWLPKRFAPRSIVVNIPEFRLRAFEDGDQPLVIKTVVGKAARQTQTPIVHADMTHIVFRPYWEVPRAIARKEILPKVAQDPQYLARHDMEIVGNRIRQRPGPDNALGLVKFIFPNPHHVYLHDTPTRALFRRSRRDFSHGCIRLADAPALARWVLRNQGSWDSTRIDRAMKEGKDNTWLALDQPLPVYLFYTTVVVDQEDRIHFYEDIYDHDTKLRELLEKRSLPS